MDDSKPKGISSATVLKSKYSRLPRTAAGKLEIIESLLRPPIFDQNDKIIGYGKPLITEEDAKRLLNLEIDECSRTNRLKK